MKIEQLDTNFSFLNWTYLFQSAFNSIEEEKVVDESMEILIQVSTGILRGSYMSLFGCSS